MAAEKISGLTALAVAPAAGDLLAIVDVSDTTDAASGTTKKITTANLFSGLSGTGLPFELVVACSDESTALTTGAAKITFRIPRAVTLTAVRASLNVAQTSGSIFTIDINEAGSTILSTKI